jgi:hypothetical protein
LTKDTTGEDYDTREANRPLFKPHAFLILVLPSFTVPSVKILEHRTHIAVDRIDEIYRTWNLPDSYG